MSEVTFAKSFLATLDKRAVKLPADHVSDPRKYPDQSPYILPRQTHPYPRRTGPTSTQKASEKTLTATLKPMRSGETITLPNITLDTTIHDLKTQYAAKSGLQLGKIKLLLNKKPAADLKTLKDVGVEGDVEFSVMLMGGASSATGTPRAASPATSPAATPAAGEPMEIDEKAPAPASEQAGAEAEKQTMATSTTEEILKSGEFWDDLKGFMSQRLRDEKQASELAAVFKEAWSKR